MNGEAEVWKLEAARLQRENDSLKTEVRDLVSVVHRMTQYAKKLRSTYRGHETKRQKRESACMN